MKTIRETDYYDIQVDRDKNRVHLCVKGNWHDYEDVRDFVNDCKVSCDATTPGFTVLVDHTKARSTVFPDLVKQSMETYMNAGLTKSAELFDEQMLSWMEMQGVSGSTETPMMRQFSSRQEAEAWLDEI
jgi:hypothetical protein